MNSPELLRYGGHLMTIGAPRSGKGVGAIISNLLDHWGKNFPDEVELGFLVAVIETTP